MTALARHRDAWREALWAHPEWWLVTLGLAAWLPVGAHGFARWHGAHEHAAGVRVEFAYWIAMVLAMMLPTLAMQARTIAFRALAERRHRAMIAFLIGYLVPWSAFGIAVAWICGQPWSHSRWVVAGSFALATAWAILPLRERAMVMAFGYTPVVAPGGWDADRDCTASGLAVGSWCLASCWALMLGCAVSSHNPVAILVGASIGVAEIRSFRPPKVFTVAASAALTALFCYRLL